MNISDFRKDLLSKSLAANLANNVKQNVNCLQEQLASHNPVFSHYVLNEQSKKIPGTNITTDEFKQAQGVEYDETKGHAAIAQNMSEINARAGAMANQPTSNVIKTFNQKAQEVLNAPEGQWSPETSAAYNEMLAAAQTTYNRKQAGEPVRVNYGTQDVNRDKGLAPKNVNFNAGNVDPFSGAFTPSSGGPAISSGEAGNAEIERRMRNIARGAGLFGKGIENTQQTPEYYELKAELDRRRGATQTQRPSTTGGQFPVYPESNRPVGRREPSAVPTAAEVKKAQAIADKTGLPTALPTNVAPGTMNMTDMDGNPIAVQPTKRTTTPKEFNQQAAIKQQAMERDVDTEGDYLYNKGGYAQSPMEWKDRYPSAYTKEPARTPSRAPKLFSMFDGPKPYSTPPETSYVSAISGDIPGMPSLKIPAPGTQDLTDVIRGVIQKGQETYRMPKKAELPVGRKIGGADPDIQRGQFEPTTAPKDAPDGTITRKGNVLYTKSVAKYGSYWYPSHKLNSQTNTWIYLPPPHPDDDAAAEELDMLMKNSPK